MTHQRVQIVELQARLVLQQTEILLRVHAYGRFTSVVLTRSAYWTHSPINKTPSNFLVQPHKHERHSRNLEDTAVVTVVDSSFEANDHELSTQTQPLCSKFRTVLVQIVQTLKSS